MINTIKGIAGILWLLVVGPIAVYGLKEISLTLAIIVYFGVLFALIHWAEKNN